MSLCFPWSFLPPRSCYFLKGCVFSWLCRTVGPVATDSLKLVQFSLHNISLVSLKIECFSFFILFVLGLFQK